MAKGLGRERGQPLTEAPACGPSPQRIVSAMTAFWAWSRFSASS